MTGLSDVAGAIDFYSTNNSATSEEKVAAKLLKPIFKPARKAGYKDTMRSIDAVDDVVRRMLNTENQAHLTTLHILDVTQKLKTDNDLRRTHFRERDKVKRRRNINKTMTQLHDDAEPHRRRVFADLEYLALHGTDAEKTAARQAIFLINSSLMSILQQYHLNETLLAKESGKDKPNHNRPDDNSNEDRPEAVEPNVPGDGDSGSSSDEEADTGTDEGTDQPGEGEKPIDKPPNPFPEDDRIAFVKSQLAEVTKQVSAIKKRETNAVKRRASADDIAIIRSELQTAIELKALLEKELAVLVAARKKWNKEHGQ
jgi:hypothetical protein